MRFHDGNPNPTWCDEQPELVEAASGERRATGWRTAIRGKGRAAELPVRSVAELRAAVDVRPSTKSERNHWPNHWHGRLGLLWR